MPRTFYSSPLPLIQEEDGSPSVRFRVLKFPNGTLTDNGDGSISHTFPYFVENGNTLELWWKGLLVHSWTYIPAAPPVGSPMGLLLTLTYPA